MTLQIRDKEKLSFISQEYKNRNKKSINKKAIVKVEKNKSFLSLKL